MDFDVDHDHQNNKVVLTTTDDTATISIWEEDGQTHVRVQQTDADGNDPSDLNLILGIEGYTQKC